MPQAARSNRAVDSKHSRPGQASASRDPSTRAFRLLRRSRLLRSCHRAALRGPVGSAGTTPRFDDNYGELAERQGTAVLTRRDLRVGQVRLLHSPPLTIEIIKENGVYSELSMRPSMLRSPIRLCLHRPMAQNNSSYL